MPLPERGAARQERLSTAHQPPVARRPGGIACARNADAPRSSASVRDRGVSWTPRSNASLGYFGVSPWSADGNRYPFHRWLQGRPTMDICVHHRGDRCARECWAQGSDPEIFEARQHDAQWLPQSSGAGAIVFNDCRERRLCRRIGTADGRNERSFDWPIQAVHPHGTRCAVAERPAPEPGPARIRVRRGRGQLQRATAGRSGRTLAGRSPVGRVRAARLAAGSRGSTPRAPTWARPSTRSITRCIHPAAQRIDVHASLAPDGWASSRDSTARPQTARICGCCSITAWCPTTHGATTTHCWCGRERRSTATGITYRRRGDGAPRCLTAPVRSTRLRRRAPVVLAGRAAGSSPIATRTAKRACVISLLCRHEAGESDRGRRVPFAVALRFSERRAGRPAPKMESGRQPLGIHRFGARRRAAPHLRGST